MRQVKYLLFLLLSFSIFCPPTILRAETLAERLRGRILIQVEGKGQAWYINPTDQKRYFLSNLPDTLQVISQVGWKKSSEQLNKILDSKNKRQLAGRFVIISNKPNTYYFYNQSLIEYSFHSGGEAVKLYRKIGLPISNKNLAKIPIGFITSTPTSNPSLTQKSTSSPLLTLMAKQIHDKVNIERVKFGFGKLTWNDELAETARLHSQDQANENQSIIIQTKLCSYPFIHHEGQVFGLYHNNRLNSQKIFNFSASAENIALVPSIKEAAYEADNVPKIDCQSELNILNTSYEARIDEAKTDQKKLASLQEEIILRKNKTKQSPSITLWQITYNQIEDVEQKAVVGWLNSPGHRRNMLNAEYNQSGVGVAQVKDYFIITQVFTKKADCGFQTGPCCEKPGYYPYCYIPLTCLAKVCQP
ncbi:MAG: CAP domain-containing protein [Candidatus Falkowbacteria bacterium]